MTSSWQSPYWNGPEMDEFSDRTEKIILWEEVAAPHLVALRAKGATTILDAGCGTGRQVERLYTAGWEVEGVTYQPKEVVAFNERCPRLAGRVREGDLHDLPYPDEAFDVVVCWDALEHTLAPLHVLGELRRVTKPGGQLLLFLPGQLWVWCPYHIIVPTIDQMNHLLILSKWKLYGLYNASQVQDQCAVYLAEKSDATPPFNVNVRFVRKLKDDEEKPA